METLIHADIFFFVATIGLIIWIALGAAALVYIVGILRSVRALSKKLEHNIEGISDEAKGFIEDIRSSGVYRFMFKKRRTHRSS